MSDAALRLSGLLAAAAFCAAAAWGEREPERAAEIQRMTALANPYANDLGPAALDEATLKTYPAEAREGYRLLRGDSGKKNCQTCHSSARPLNSRFLELEAANLSEQKKAIAALRSEHPEYFSDKNVWQIEPGIWRRYIKRMMAKPGCGVSNQDGKKIWRFLVHDGKRKLGANAQRWKAHRLKLIQDMKALNPKRYEELLREDSL